MISDFNPLSELPLPPHFRPNKAGKVWRVDYQKRASEALKWARKYKIQPASHDKTRLTLIVVDAQNTFCIPGFELFVRGKTGIGSVEDNQRLCEFIYRNLSWITSIVASMDTHLAMQIFHPIFLVNELGDHPNPHTQITSEDVKQGRWKFNPQVAASLNIDPEYGQAYLLYYTEQLKAREKYDLTIWPYHSMLGGIGHALVSAIEEALFFHTIARASQVEFEIKGRNPLTEHYSILGPEVLNDPLGMVIGEKNSKFMQVLQDNDAVIIAGQAKSHCVAWTIDDLLGDIRTLDESLAKKVYLLEDCTSPVVVKDVVDFSLAADAAFARFAEAGMHVVHSTEPIWKWPGFPRQDEG
jgi:nicotinamidase-related amidase